MDFVVAIYHASKRFPKEEIYGLTSQIRRAAVSVPSNIAEGQGGLSKGEFAQFLGHARGSLAEVNTQIQIAERLGILTQAEAADLTGKGDEIGRMLSGLLAALRKQPTGN